MSSKDQYILVTGANSGLGLGICCSLIDDFLKRAHADGDLTIIFTTRSSRKASDTLATLERHLAKHGRLSSSGPQVHFRPENVDLTNLLTIRALSRKLLGSDIPHLNAVVLNAGIGGWSGLNWPLAIWTILTSIRQATTWPTFKAGLVGLVTKPQCPQDTASSGREEPVLGEVFCANVFGHYLLVHWLVPLLRACQAESPGKIIWTSSVEPSRQHYNPDDHQGLTTDAAYEHSKRLTDSLALTAEHLRANVSAIKDYTTPSATVTDTRSSRPSRSTPAFHVAHPGICSTAIIELYWIVFQCYVLGVYLARWCGSPWANGPSYKGAKALSWLALASPSEIESKKLEAAGDRGGPIKWGSSTSQFGTTTVKPTDVDGWGINGTGKSFKDTWWGGNVGRKSGAQDATTEDVEDFLETGAGAWKEMEALRKDWEARLEKYEAEHANKSSNGKAS